MVTTQPSSRRHTQCGGKRVYLEKNTVHLEKNTGRLHYHPHPVPKAQEPVSHTYQHSIGVMPKTPENPEPHGCAEQLRPDHLAFGQLGKLSVPGLDVYAATSAERHSELVSSIAEQCVP